MNDEIMNEIRKAAELLGMSESDATAKFEEICSKNSVDASQEPLLARGLWRQFFSNSRNAMKRQNTQQQSSNSLFKPAFGFFIALDDARDMAKMNRERITNEYMRDSATTYDLGKIAIFTQLDEGYEGRMMKDNEEVIRVMDNLPANHVEVDTQQFIVPLDTRQGDWNKNYGKPLPKVEYRRSGVFLGEVDGVMGKWFFSYKGDSSKTFQPKTFEFVHFTCIPNSFNKEAISGGTTQTLESLVYNVDLPEGSEMKRNIDSVSLQDSIMQFCEGNYSPLVDLDRYHSQVMSKAYADRFVFTDGSVTSINMTPTSNGNRIINLDDLNTDFDFDNEGWSGTTCWIPSNVNIDFGIGSNVIVVGRTSQSRDESGAPNPTTINVNGIYIVTNRGGSPEQIDFVEEDEDSWFFD